MLRAAVGITHDKRGRTAAFEAASRAMARAGATRADLCLAFATPDHRAEMQSALNAIRHITQAPHVVGCTGAGILTCDGEHEGQSALGVLVACGAELRVRPFLVHTLDTPADQVASALERSLAAGGPGDADPPVLLLAFLGALGSHPILLLDRLAALAPDVPIVGGGAVGTPDGADVWLDGEVVRGGACGLSIGGVPRPAVGIAHGCRPVGHLMTVTRARGNLVFELDGKPAFEPFARLCREPLLADLRRAAAFVFAGLPTGSGGRADYRVRSFVGFDPQGGVLAISEPVEEGQRLTFLVREAAGARRDLEAMLGEIEERLAGARPALGLYINCAGRGQGLYGIPDHDVAYIKRALGDFPLLGFSSAAEIAPLGGGPALEMYTGVLTVFADVAQA